MEDLVVDMVANLVGKEEVEEVLDGKCESQRRRHLLVVCLLYLKSLSPWLQLRLQEGSPHFAIPSVALSVED